MASCNSKTQNVADFDSRIIAIGKELTSLDNFNKSNLNTNFLIEDIVNVGENLFNEIQKQKPFDKPQFNVKKGDIPTYGNNTADYTLEILNRESVIKIRLKYDKVYDKFHILGFTTVGDDSN